MGIAAWIHIWILKILHKVKEEEIPPNSFYEVSITIMLKTDKDTIKNKIINLYP
jgi:hypothetical protein